MAFAGDANARAGFNARRNARHDGFALRSDAHPMTGRAGERDFARPIAVGTARRAADDTLLLTAAIAGRTTHGSSRHLVFAMTGGAGFAAVDFDARHHTA